MKKITPLVLMIFLFANTLNAQNNYPDLWEKVHRFELKDLPKSALKIVDEIYAKAEREQNSPQLVKTLFYKSKFALILEEDAQLKVINDFKKHINNASFPTKNVLENVLANLYWQYFKQNRWQFYDRTKTENKVDETDFRTWDLETLFTEIQTHYNTSLAEKERLQKVDIYKFADILQLVKSAKELRPTLYDFLAHNALEFYKTDENNITKPAYQFKLDNPALLSDAKTFSKLDLTTKDTLSLQFNALKIYQDLISFHLKENNLKALVDVDLLRLSFVHHHATFKDKNQLFEKALENGINTYNKNEISGLYAYALASRYHSLSSSYHKENNPKPRFKNKEALAICNDIIERFPKSDGAKKCEYLKAQILRKNVSITTEKYIPISQNSRLLVNYKNIDKLYFSAYKINREELIKYHNLPSDSTRIDFIKKLDKSHSWDAKLHNEHDYLQHTTEIIVPKMAQANYLLVATETPTLEEDSLYGTANMQVTNLVLVEEKSDGIYTYQVVNRNNGSPIKNANINLKNYNTGRYNKPINKNFTTDKNGFFTYKSSSRHNQVVVTVKSKDDTATFGDYYLYKYRKNNNVEKEETRIKPFIFTDRSIYRPGQKLYFKAIVIKRENQKSTVFTNEHVEATLRNVNGEDVKKLHLKLNGFGSVSGEFDIPNNGLTGEYSIVIDESSEHDSKFYDKADYYFEEGYTYISVEEYKRPKFKTEFKPFTESYKINDSITVNGFAKSFAGATVTDAKVVYRVHRKVQYPSWWYWRRPSFSSEAQEITNGESITDASGNFSITFKAIPDESVAKENQPIFTYEVTADVTDINGETRSATTNIKVGYHSLVAKIEMPQQLDVQEKKNLIKITTENLNGEFVPAKGTLKIYKLQAPQHPLRSSPWNAPDYQVILESEFRKLFPYDAYTDDESKVKNWKKGALVFSKDFDTEDSKEIDLKNIKKWISGRYIAVVETQDKFKQEVKDEARFTVFNSKKTTVSDNELFTIKTNKNSYEPGENVLLQIGSASKDITVVVQIEREHEIVKTQLIHLDNEVETLKIPVTKSDEKEGGFAIKYHFVNYNYFKSGNIIVNVANKEENISIETKTFRDKLQPGSEQTWSFTIKNDENDAVTAEVLASMYDASLDEFKSHSWQFNPIQKSIYYSYNRSSAGNSFGTEYFRVRNQNRGYFPKPEYQKYHSYNWFGFSFTGNRWLNREYKHNLILQRTKFDDIFSGVVKDESGPLPGINVTIKGTKFGTTTDFDGKFSLRANKGDKVVFSFIGFKTIEKTIGDFSNISIFMESDENSLDEVVVTAQGIKREKKALGYATSRISSEEIQEDAKADVAGILSGKVAGVQVNSGGGFLGDKSVVIIKAKNSISGNNQPLYVVDGVVISGDESLNINANDILSTSVLKGMEATTLYGAKAVNGVIFITTKKSLQDLNNVKARKNLQETAFFYPNLTTDKKGNITFSFTAPEALTRWKLQLLAHTKSLQTATKTLSAVTQKELMVVPNAPRFLRQGDTIVINSKISNLSNKNLQGLAQLVITNAVTGKEIDLFTGTQTQATRNFSIDKKGNTNVSWTLAIPNNIDAVQYKIVAKAGDFSDGEQNALPVLSNRMLVTETVPMWVRSNQTKTFRLDKLKNNQSSSLHNHKLTLEVTSNPAWYAVQALPYLIEYPYECSEQTFSKFYANTLASHIANSNPKVQEVFNQWKSSDALLSNLEKNQELKSLIIQETPWLRDAQSETEQKKRIALLFDLNRMKNEQKKTINKLQDMQFSNGGFPWFKGSDYPNPYITNYITSGFGHLQKLGVPLNNKVNGMVKKSVTFLDEEIVDAYQDLLEKASKIKAEKGSSAMEDYLNKNNLSHLILQYLYTRSFYKNIPINDKLKTVVDYYNKQSVTYWQDYNLYTKAQIALVQFRNGNASEANKILASLKENSITSDKLGMYWKSNVASWYWYQAPIETQALLIEAFSEIENDTKTIDNLKIWLLKNKQVNRWKTTKATSEAVYALLLQGSDWISVTDMVDITLGDIKIEPNKMKDVAVEAGTGYFKTSWNSQEITPNMSEVTISKKGKGIAWGGLYWQYFEDLDKISSAETPLKLKKKLFKKVNGDTGKELIAVTDKSSLKVGDLLTVRIELRADRNMSFIHMKDMRASGVEPINVLSKYKWQDGLGYYESTKDASTNFFFDRLPKGVYVFEYDVRVNNAGDFSNGITTIESMYAPEFKSHSEGVRISVE